MFSANKAIHCLFVKSTCFFLDHPISFMGENLLILKMVNNYIAIKVFQLLIIIHLHRSDFAA